VLSSTRSRTLSNAAWLTSLDRTEQPRPEAKRIGVLGAHARVGLPAGPSPPRRSASPTADERLGARVARQPVEIDLAGLRARALAQQHVAALDEAQPEAVVAAARALRIERAARREQRAGRFSGSLPKYATRWLTASFSSIRIERLRATEALD
jgi:hypothetical protein